MGNRSSVKRKLFSYIPYSYNSSTYVYGKKEYLIRPITRSRTAADNPKYKNLIDKGLPATNTYSGFVQRIYLEPGVVKGYAARSGFPPSSIRFNNTSCNARFADSTNCPFPTSLENGMTALRLNAKNKAAINIRKKIQSETQKYSGPQFLGEFRDTVHMLKHPAEAAMEFAHKYFVDVKRKSKRKHYTNQRQLRKAFAGSILELNFGLKPLVNDIGAIALASIKQIEDIRIKRISAGGSAENATSGTDGPIPAGNYYLYYDVETISIAQHNYTVGYKTENSVEGGLQSLIGRQTLLKEFLDFPERIFDVGGFTADQIIPTIWELLPLSVFMDYFSNIGDVLNTSFVNLENVVWTNSCSRSTTTRRYTNCRFPSDSIWQFDREQTISPYAEVETKWVERDASAIAIPQLRFELPSSPIRLANLGAFLTLLTT